ncbi:hypothetical protein KSP39_PZI022446 [Platanthera zijinensis]|uniref:Uncharacterized protein n=1 Tax=Platanthera zijinensis TaxID=2320716 RepID=A0AAP0AW44_9ASPA
MLSFLLLLPPSILRLPRWKFTSHPPPRQPIPPRLTIPCQFHFCMHPVLLSSSAPPHPLPTLLYFATQSTIFSTP